MMTMLPVTVFTFWPLSGFVDLHGEKSVKVCGKTCLHFEATWRGNNGQRQYQQLWTRFGNYMHNTETTQQLKNPHLIPRFHQVSRLSLSHLCSCCSKFAINCTCTRAPLLLYGVHVYRSLLRHNKNHVKAIYLQKITIYSAKNCVHD